RRCRPYAALGCTSSAAGGVVCDSDVALGPLPAQGTSAHARCDPGRTAELRLVEELHPSRTELIEAIHLSDVGRVGESLRVKALCAVDRAPAEHPGCPEQLDAAVVATPRLRRIED